MFMVQALLAADLSALSVVVGCGVHLVRQAHHQAEVKASAQPAVAASVACAAEPEAHASSNHFSSPLLDSVVLRPVQSSLAAEAVAERHMAPPVAEFAERIAMASRFTDIRSEDEPAIAAPVEEAAQILQWPEAALTLDLPAEVAATVEEEELAEASLFVATPNRQQMGWVDELPVAAIAPVAPAAVTVVAVPLPAELELDLLADPVDGVAFEAGEQIALCVCRTAYRIPTLEWLGENNAGNCVQCGRHVSEEHQYILPKATQRELTLAG